MKKITVITGHYGSGKSTFAANYAIKCAEQGEQVTVVDMDTVNHITALPTWASFLPGRA